jgi:hypothetical protein
MQVGPAPFKVIAKRGRGAGRKSQQIGLAKTFLPHLEHIFHKKSREKLSQ